MDHAPSREAAIARLREKRRFWTHAIAYVVVNVALIVIWAIQHDAGSGFYPGWTALGWGIGLAIHAWVTFRRPISEAAIQREMGRVG